VVICWISDCKEEKHGLSKSLCAGCTVSKCVLCSARVDMYRY
jgi:hypothetical protein